MSDFTEEELAKIEANYNDPVVMRLIKALRLWNKRAHTARKEGDRLASGLGDSADVLLVAGEKCHAENAKLRALNEQYLGQIREQAKTIEVEMAKLRAEVEAIRRIGIDRAKVIAAERDAALLQNREYRAALEMIYASCGGNGCTARDIAKAALMEKPKCGVTIPEGRSGGVSLCDNERPCPIHALKRVEPQQINEHCTCTPQGGALCGYCLRQELNRG